MPEKTIIPFGPQHPVLPEPLHLDLVMEDETVVDAIPSIGFIHRGLERLAEAQDFQQMGYVAERICGICSCIHGQGYSQGIEALLDMEVPARAQFLRLVWGEESRIQSHLLWLGLAADAFGFESLFMHTWKLRERLLDWVERTTGGRVIFGANKIGGVRRDVADGLLNDMVADLKAMEAEFTGLEKTFLNDATVRSRMVGVGVLPKALAMASGAVGPTLRASGVASDTRTLGYSAYGQVQWQIITESAGDCFARIQVRCRETHQSFDMIYQAVARMPAGPVENKPKGFPKGEFMARLEQPRGEVIYYLKGNGTKHLERFRVRTPTFANIPALVSMLKGARLADVGNILLTIDPCISCTER
jgi:ech hydrogenase subunit E